MHVPSAKPGEKYLGSHFSKIWRFFEIFWKFNGFFNVFSASKTKTSPPQAKNLRTLRRAKYFPINFSFLSEDPPKKLAITYAYWRYGCIRTLIFFEITNYISPSTFYFIRKLEFTRRIWWRIFRFRTSWWASALSSGWMCKGRWVHWAYWGAILGQI